jgi:hypothetical protein
MRRATFSDRAVTREYHVTVRNHGKNNGQQKKRLSAICQTIAFANAYYNQSK